MAVIIDDAEPVEGHALLSLTDNSNPTEATFRAECECGYPGFNVKASERLARAEWAAHRDAER